MPNIHSIFYLITGSHFPFENYYFSSFAIVVELLLQVSFLCQLCTSGHLNHGTQTNSIILDICGRQRGAPLRFPFKEGLASQLWGVTTSVIRNYKVYLDCREPSCSRLCLFPDSSDMEQGGITKTWPFLLNSGDCDGKYLLQISPWVG